LTDQLDKDTLIERLARNPHLAHATLFHHRHPSQTPSFHTDIVNLWYSSAPRVLVEAFRGGAKSTLAEEAICIMACLRMFRNGLILGETFERAVERLKAIKHEFEENDFIAELFGDMVGTTWTESKIVLTNGIALQAVGRGQSLRGVKHLDARPDLAFFDDIENEESVATPEARDKTMRWVMSVVLPALDPKHRMRMNGTPLDPEAVLVQLSRDKAWVHRKFPIKHKDPEGDWQPTWPDRFPLAMVDALEGDYKRLGLANQFAQEYMCQAEDPATKQFTADMFRVKPRVHDWQATYAMYDPARTIKTSSATTGVVVFSWLANRLVIWDAYGHRWKPDEIIADMFRVDDEFRPITIGVERDGLEEFMLQPLRQEQLRRGYAIPIRPMKAPRGKIDFIKGLQPFFKAGEVEFVKDLPDLKAQLLSFPTGDIDVPNALAYAMMLRPGQPIYEGFSTANVAEEIIRLPRAPMFLAVNGTQMFTTAALIQTQDGVFNVIWDAVREGDPGATLSGILVDAGLEAGQRPRLYAPPEHFGNYDTIGLRGAARKVPVDLGQSGLALDGRDEVRALLTRQVRGQSALRVSRQARWTLNAFAGGYCKEVLKTGMISEFATEGPYKTLMEGIESFASLLKMGDVSREQPLNYAVSPDGRRYLSSRAVGGRRG
jgi:hypothetical protein